MKDWKYLIPRLLVITYCIAQFALLHDGFGLFFGLYIYPLFLSFITGILISHRRGFQPLLPIFFTLFYAGFLAIISYFTYKDLSMISLENFQLLLIVLVPSAVGVAIGTLTHHKKWLQHPILLPVILISLFLIPLLVNASYSMPLISPERPSYYLTIAIPGLLALVGLLVGYLDKKGYLVPLSLALVFALYYGFANAVWLNLYTPAYLLVGYAALFLGRLGQRKKK